MPIFFDKHLITENQVSSVQCTITCTDVRAVYTKTMILKPRKKVYKQGLDNLNYIII